MEKNRSDLGTPERDVNVTRGDTDVREDVGRPGAARQDSGDRATTTDQARRIEVRRGEMEGRDRTETTMRGTPGEARDEEIALLPERDLDDFRGRWDRIQVAFVDQPREAVQSAHDLVDDLVGRLTDSFSRQRGDLEGTWSKGGDVSTEDLRLALRRYRSFFNRLLST